MSSRTSPRPSPWRVIVSTLPWQVLPATLALPLGHFILQLGWGAISLIVVGGVSYNVLSALWRSRHAAASGER